MAIKSKVKNVLKIQKNQIYRFITLKIIFPNWYKWNAKKCIEENKVVFIEVRLPAISNSFQVLIKTYI